MNFRKLILVLAGLALMLGLGASSCESASDVASRNVSTAADNFEVNRLIVGINLRTDTVLFSVEGPCSIERDGDLIVVCKESANPDTFKKHYVGLGPNAGDGISWISTQLGPIEANQFRTRFILRPTTVIPDFDLELGF